MSKPEAAAKAKPKAETFFLDPEASSSLGDVKFMKRSNTIRHTFPGNADSPGDKEMVAEVASMEARVEKMTPGLAGIQPSEKSSVNLTGGIFVNQAAAFSDFHVSGANPAGNATLCDGAFVSGRFRVVQSRIPVPTAEPTPAAATPAAAGA